MPSIKLLKGSTNEGGITRGPCRASIFGGGGGGGVRLKGFKQTF